MKTIDKILSFLAVVGCWIINYFVILKPLWGISGGDITSESGMKAGFAIAFVGFLIMCPITFGAHMWHSHAKNK